MEKYKVFQYSNLDEFQQRVSLCRNEKTRFFTVKLFNDKFLQNYEVTVYIEINGEFLDSDIKPSISNLLNPKYNYVVSYQIFEVTNKI